MKGLESAGGDDGHPHRSGTESLRLLRANVEAAPECVKLLGRGGALLLLGGIGVVNFQGLLENRALSARRSPSAAYEDKN